MNKKDVIKFAHKAGFELVNGDIHVEGEDITDYLVLLLNIVEQAALDRASNEISESISEMKNIGIETRQIIGASIAMECVNELKDSND